MWILINNKKIKSIISTIVFSLIFIQIAEGASVFKPKPRVTTLAKNRYKSDFKFAKAYLPITRHTSQLSLSEKQLLAKTLFFRRIKRAFKKAGRKLSKAARRVKRAAKKLLKEQKELQKEQEELQKELPKEQEKQQSG